MATAGFTRCLASANGDGGQCRIMFGDVRRSLAPSRFRIRARGLRCTCGRAIARVMPTDPGVPQDGRSGPYFVTFVTQHQGIMSQTASACRWTIEMTQFVFRRAGKHELRSESSIQQNRELTMASSVRKSNWQRMDANAVCISSENRSNVVALSLNPDGDRSK